MEDIGTIVQLCQLDDRNKKGALNELSLSKFFAKLPGSVRDCVAKSLYAHLLRATSAGDRAALQSVFGGGMIDQARVRELFDYREDGQLIWKLRTGFRVGLGDIAGNLHKSGYREIRFDGKLWKAHRIVWLWHHGYLPEYDVDHRNRRRADNRIENLREISRSCNLRNTANTSANTSGVKGVSWNKLNSNWRTYILDIMLGSHEDFLEAVCHRLAAEQALDWAGCDSCSPAFQYVKNHIPGIS